jgi:uncharacterized protein (TIGR04222 family)
MLTVLKLSGPTFLLVYAALAAAICLYIRRRIATAEAQSPARILRVRDPYEIAYLRGGIDELIQVAVLALLRRRLLEPVSAFIRTQGSGRTPGSTPIENAILDACRDAPPAAKLKQYDSIQAAAQTYRAALIDANLMPTPQMQGDRNSAASIAGAVLISVALAKIWYATAHGHRNVLALILFAVVAGVALFGLASAHRTRAGDQAVQHLKTLFARVKNGASPSLPDELHEALLLAAVYGDYAAAGVDQSTWRKLFPQRSDNRGGNGCGSGCGSSGCGGGGGGGCGGCGS